MYGDAVKTEEGVEDGIILTKKDESFPRIPQLSIGFLILTFHFFALFLGTP